MTDFHLFQNEEFGKLRGFLDEDGNPWFVAADVCAALDLDNITRAISSLDDDEKMTLTNSKGHSGQRGGAQSLNVISEPGLYSLILRSRKPSAKAFKRWVTHEVIPSIRKTGQYTNCQAKIVTIATPDGEFFDLLAYVSVLRHMARLKSYPDRMRMGFLAEAASLLSGYPPSRFLPSEETFYPLFQ